MTGSLYLYGNKLDGYTEDDVKDKVTVGTGKRIFLQDMSK